MKQFLVKVHVDGHYTVEDPKCPSYWHGSGCYDIDIETWCDAELEIWANSEEDASKMAEEYDYAEEYTNAIDDVEIKSIEFIAELDRDEPEAGVVDAKNVVWKEHEQDYD